MDEAKFVLPVSRVVERPVFRYSRAWFQVAGLELPRFGLHGWSLFFIGRCGLRSSPARHGGSGSGSGLRRQTPERRRLGRRFVRYPGVNRLNCLHQIVRLIG